MSDQAIQRATIHASPERCFAVASEFARYPDWAHDVKQATVLTSDDTGRAGEVEFRAAAMGRSSTYVLRYNYGANPLRLSWRLIRGDLMTRLDGEYEFAAVPGEPDITEVTYSLAVDLRGSAAGFVKRRAEARIVHTALDELKAAAERQPVASSRLARPHLAALGARRVRKFVVIRRSDEGMRLLELRLIEDHRSVLRFPGELHRGRGDVAERARLGRESGPVASRWRGMRCVRIRRDRRVVAEVGPGALAQRFLTQDTAVVLDSAPFRAVVADLDRRSAGSTRSVRVTDDRLQRARTTFETTMQNLQVLERSVELSEAEHRGALVAHEDIRRSIEQARLLVDPIAATVHDRAVDAAARLEVETGAPPGVCRAETPEAATARLVRLEAVLYELDSALHALSVVDTTTVEEALEVVRIITADGLIDVPEAICLADDYRRYARGSAAVEERVASDEGGMTGVKDRLDHARERVANAEAKLQPAQTSHDDIAALEHAHDAVLEAERRVEPVRWNVANCSMTPSLKSRRSSIGWDTRPGRRSSWAHACSTALRTTSANSNSHAASSKRPSVPGFASWHCSVTTPSFRRTWIASNASKKRPTQSWAMSTMSRRHFVRSRGAWSGPHDARCGPHVLAECLTDLGFGIEERATLDDLEDAARSWLAEVRRDQDALRSARIRCQALRTGARRGARDTRPHQHGGCLRGDRRVRSATAASRPRRGHPRRAAPVGSSRHDLACRAARHRGRARRRARDEARNGSDASPGTPGDQP